MEEDNVTSLQIYRNLRRAVEECEPHAAPHLNLTAIFFHDLMRILTGYALRVHDLNGPFRPVSTDELRPLKRFPYVDFLDVRDGLNPSSKTYGLVAPRVAPGNPWTFAASRIIGSFLGTRGTIAIAKPSALRGRHLVSALLRARMRVEFPSPTPLAIPGLTDQLGRLNLCIREIAETLGWQQAAEPIIEVVERHIRALVVAGEHQEVSYQVLICGSLANNFDRFIAARARASGVPVVEISHGAAEGILDEPVFGYGERTFATTMLGFGRSGAAVSQEGEYAQSLYDPPDYVESDSPEVREIFRGPEVAPLGRLVEKSIFYLPTSFSGGFRYGPFRDMPDGMYLRWQETLFREFPEAMWKGHPKERSGFWDSGSKRQLVPSGATRTSRIPLQDCLHQAELFMFDYLSTAFCQAAATSKPIIFFDIGLRNHTVAAQRAISERCICIKVDLDRPVHLKEQVLAVKQEPRTNSFSEEFSLAAEPATKGRIGVALDVIKGLLR